MKLILLILLLSPCFLKAQYSTPLGYYNSVVLVPYGITLEDTIGVMSTTKWSGTFYIDTIPVKNNTSQYFLLSLKGGTAKATKFIQVSNTNGKYAIISNTNPIAFSGLIGGKLEVVVVNNLVMVKITGTKDIIDWELTRINLLYK